MSTEPNPHPTVDERAQANLDAAALAKAQTEAATAEMTERNIQCQRAHEIIDLWFATWEPADAKHWDALAGGEDPSSGAALALVEACLGFAPDHTKPAEAEAPAEPAQPA